MSKPKKRVALVLREISDHLRNNLYGILNYVRKHTSWEVYTEGTLPRLTWDRLSEWDGDGMIVAIDTPEELKRVLAKDIFTVNVSSRLPGLTLPTVVSDNVAIGELAANHLLEQGLNSFAFVGPMDLDHNVKRLEGFSRTLQSAGRTCRSYAIRYLHRQFEFDKQSIVDIEYLGEELVRCQLPVGVFAPHDDMGCWVLKACSAIGLDVPRQVAVLGVDNFELLCDFSSPPLTSVAQSSYRIGFEAAKLLDQLMSGEPPPREPILIPPVGVVARQSTDVLAVDDPDVAEALRFIRNHADQHITLADILDHVAVSRRSLEIRFKNAIGHSVEQETINVRMHRAKQLLSETVMPITQVAFHSGDQSSTGFSVAFRKETGMSPRDYRKHLACEMAAKRSG